MRRTYDARNRPKTLTFPDGRGNQSWAYTPDGLPAQITTQNGDGTAAVVNTYVYNKRRLLTGETLSQNGVLNLSLGQGYNSNGHLSAQTWPQGPQVTYAPNALGQPTQAGILASGVQYYPNGAVQQFVYGNGIVHQMQQNARQLPARSTDTGTLDLRTSFDVNGNVTAISDLVRGTGFDRQMQYDGNDRLTNAYSPAFGGDGWYRFGYDALDNLRTWTQPGEGQRRYEYDSSNRMRCRVSVAVASEACAALRAVATQGVALRIVTCAGRLRRSPGTCPVGHAMRVCSWFRGHARLMRVFTCLTILRPVGRTLGPPSRTPDSPSPQGVTARR